MVGMSDAWALPLFLNKQNKAWTCGLVALLATVLYLFSNHVHVFEPVTLPVTALDTAIPFVPHTVWIYISEYWAIVLLFALSRDLVNANRFAYAFAALQVVCASMFMLWPTTYPRAQFPLPPDLDAPTRSVLAFLRSIDTPANCCPSLHVASICLPALFFRREHRSTWPLLWAGVTAIVVSTLTTKQHYVVDVIGGVIVAVVLYWFFQRVVEYR
jgi:membrane-associated phospholipid phosphatase